MRGKDATNSRRPAICQFLNGDLFVEGQPYPYGSPGPFSSGMGASVEVVMLPDSCLSGLFGTFEGLPDRCEPLGVFLMMSRPMMNTESKKSTKK
jgi:hypothetical protein